MKYLIKRLRRILTLGLSAAISLSLLAACGPGTGNGTSGSDDTQGTTTETDGTTGTKATDDDTGLTEEPDPTGLNNGVNLLTALAAHFEIPEGHPDPDNWLGQYGSTDEDEAALLAALLEFSEKNFNLLAEDHEEANLLLSPLSFYVDLAMLGEGTAGSTRDEINSALAGLTEDGGDFLETIRPQITRLLGGMNSSRKKFTMRAGQSLWFRPDIPIHESYLDLLETNYFTEAYLADFAGAPEEVAGSMKDWVSEKTAGMLGDDLPIQIQAQDVFYLLQTLYFKDSWLMPFSVDRTEDQTFRLADGSTKEVPFMKQSEVPAWGYNGDMYQAAELLTEQGFSFRVVLPHEVLSLDQALKLEGVFDILYSDHLFDNETDPAGWEDDWYVHWELPKFDVQADVDLIDLLGKLGVSEVQSPQADFSNAADVEPGAYFLDQAKQQVRVKVDEKGVEAAAVTILAVAESLPQTQGDINMTLDRPFFFSISTPSGLPLFLAWVGDVGAS